MDMYRQMLRSMISKSIDTVMNENGFVVREILGFTCKDASIGKDICLDFDYLVNVWDARDNMCKLTLSGCGYVNNTGVHVVKGAWDTEEGWS